MEYGICLERGNKKAFGAGLLSSFGELQYCLTDEPSHEPFDPNVTAVTKYPITSFQPKYFIAESFADAKSKLMTWTSTIKRPFQVRYNPYTQRVEILDNLPSVQSLVRDIKGQLFTLEDALNKLNTH